MLKGIPEIISPDLMYAMMQMGHGDDMVIGDINFPSYSKAQRVVYESGHGIVEILDAILPFFPLDTYEDCVTVMQTGGGYQGVPPIWEQYRKVFQKHDFCNAFKDLAQVERSAFYERACKSFVTVHTSEPAFYACMIIKKGVSLP